MSWSASKPVDDTPLVNEAYLSLAVGLSAQDVTEQLAAQGCTGERQRRVLAQAKKKHSTALRAAKTPLTFAQLQLLHLTMLHQALQRGRVDVAQRVLSALTQLASDAPDATGLVWDAANPRKLLETMLEAVARGQRITPAAGSMVARAIAALELVKPENPENEEKPDVPKTLEEYQARCLKLVGAIA